MANIVSHVRSAESDSHVGMANSVSRTRMANNFCHVRVANSVGHFEKVNSVFNVEMANSVSHGRMANSVSHVQEVNSDSHVKMSVLAMLQCNRVRHFEMAICASFFWKVCVRHVRMADSFGPFEVANSVIRSEIADSVAI
jgi:hypothetical protein